MPRQAIALLVHQDVAQINALAEILEPDFDLYIHVDKKSDVSPESINTSNVWKKYKIHWGGFGMVQATTFLYKKILDSNIAYSHIILLSGDSLPVKPNDHIVNFLNKYPSISFLENNPANELELDRRRYLWFRENLKNKATGIFKYMNPFKVIRKLQSILNIKRNTKGFERTGGQWTILALDHVKHLMDNCQFNEYKLMAIPDESFVQNHFTQFKLPYRETLIYANWPANRGQSPQLIDEKKFISLVESRYLFARKFDLESVSLLQYLGKTSYEAVNESASSR